jgi:hypothetical protein
MQPLTVVLGIVFGSLAAIAFSLAVVLLIFFLGRSEQPRLAAEVPELVRSTVLFSACAVMSGMAFLDSLKLRSRRTLTGGLMVLSLAAAAAYYWPA